MDRSKLYDYSDGSKFLGKSAEEIFTQIEKDNVWLDKESVSGIGSTHDQTKHIIKEIPRLLVNFKIKTLLDVPCGDFNWFQQIDLSEINYTGGDIVKSLVERNNQKYKRENINFIHFNLLEDIPTKTDLIFCRDCLVHFSLEDIYKALANIKQSKSKYLITTTFPDEKENKDIITGGWRPLNFEKKPFNFPKPEFIINEMCSEMDGAFKDKSLGVWEVKDIL